MKGDPSILRFLLASRDKSADMERSQELLETLVILIMKSVKDPRSVVCKTALMTCADIFKAYGALMDLPFTTEANNVALPKEQEYRDLAKSVKVCLSTIAREPRQFLCHDLGSRW